MSSKAKCAAQTIRFTLGATAFAAGADKFFNRLTNWEQYLSPAVSSKLPVSPQKFMRLTGVVEMVVGTAILTGHTKFGGCVAGLWLLGISGNLISTGKYFDIAARDINMAIEAFTLAKLS